MSPTTPTTSSKPKTVRNYLPSTKLEKTNANSRNSVNSQKRTKNSVDPLLNLSNKVYKVPANYSGRVTVKNIFKTINMNSTPPEPPLFTLLFHSFQAFWQSIKKTLQLSPNTAKHLRVINSGKKTCTLQSKVYRKFKEQKKYMCHINNNYLDYS